VKETPSVIILDEGKPAVEKDRPKRSLIMIFTLFLGFMIGLSNSIIKKLL